MVAPRHSGPTLRGAPGKITERGEWGELRRMLVRTVLPVAVVLLVVLAVYGGTGHDLTFILQDRFPDDSEYSGLLTIVFGCALMVCAGVALGALVTARAWFGSEGAGGASRPAAVSAGLGLSALMIFIGFDDVMMVHDAILPGAGIPEDAGLAAYGLVGLALVSWAFRPLRREGLAPCFLGGLGLLAGSLGGDVVEALFEESNPAIATVIGHAEDVVKFLAYAALCHLAVLLARRLFARTLQVATEKAARDGAEAAPGRVPVRVRPSPAPRVPESPAVGSPAVGSPAVGSPAVGSPAVGSPAVGSRPASRTPGPGPTTSGAVARAGRDGVPGAPGRPVAPPENASELTAPL